MSDKGMEIGNMQPFRTLLSELSRWEFDDRARRPADDPALLVVERVRRGLEKALSDAQNPVRQPTVAEQAELEGVSRWAVYKRRQREQRASRREAAA